MPAGALEGKTEGKTTKTRDVARGSPWLQLLSGEAPNGYESAEQWFAEREPIIADQTEQITETTCGATYNTYFKSRLVSAWRFDQERSRI